MKPVEELRVNMWRPYFYDNYNRVGNCTVINLNEHVDALIKVLSSKKMFIGKHNQKHVLQGYTSLRIYWKMSNGIDGNLLKQKAYYFYQNGKIQILNE